MFSVRHGDILRPHDPERRRQGLWVIKYVCVISGTFHCHRWKNPAVEAEFPINDVDLLVHRKD